MNQSNIWNEVYAKKNSNQGSGAGRWIGKYEEFIESQKGHRILELGCGEGETSIFLHNQSYQVVACDFSSIVLERIKESYPELCVNHFDMCEGILILN